MDTEMVELVKLVGSMGWEPVLLIVGMKYVINGMGKNIAEIKADLKTVLVGQAEHSTRLAVLEATKEAIDAGRPAA